MKIYILPWEEREVDISTMTGYSVHDSFASYQRFVQDYWTGIPPGGDTTGLPNPMVTRLVVADIEDDHPLIDRIRRANGSLQVGRNVTMAELGVING
jgi:hypothetical protein